MPINADEVSLISNEPATRLNIVIQILECAFSPLKADSVDTATTFEQTCVNTAEFTQVTFDLPRVLVPTEVSSWIMAQTIRRKTFSSRKSGLKTICVYTTIKFVPSYLDDSNTTFYSIFRLHRIPQFQRDTLSVISSMFLRSNANVHYSRWNTRDGYAPKEKPVVEWFSVEQLRFLPERVVCTGHFLALCSKITYQRSTGLC